ncbi:MAG: adenosylcobinamide-GDP ribazoletransferase [Clostridium sp.]|nr:adenosylcobinamide-GDP ribazoletransferase [Clostridium sp.]
MNVIYSIIIAFSMYSAVPMPRCEWTAERMRYVFCAFPLVGAAEGLILCLLAAGLDRIPLLQGSGTAFMLFRILLFTALPLLYTGGIHMDGYLDVTDARRSFGDREKKLEIMKDPHVGAFAVIGCGIYLLLYAMGMSIPVGMGNKAGLAAFACTLPAERALSAVAVSFFPKAKRDGLAAEFAEGAEKKAVAYSSVLWITASFSAAVFAAGMTGFILSAGALASFLWFKTVCVREFGGVTGDLAGYFLQCCERNMVLLLAVCSLLFCP